MDQKNNDINMLRHSAAHLLAHAVKELYPTTKLTIGPVTAEGFFYDFLPTTNFKEEDLAIIEAKMHEIADRNLPIEQKTISKEEARKLFHDNPFKLELINEIPGNEVGLSTQGSFYDLCKGGHVASTGQLKHFRLLNISGSYWRADREKQALQRISGIAFASAKDMEEYDRLKEEAAMYDHRKIGKQQELFSFDDVAAGCPFFHPKGMVIFNTLADYIRSAQKNTYKEVRTPIIMRDTLWKTSGHYDHYREKMYFTTIDELPCCIKPMSCPAHSLIFKERPRSYRDLPMRLSEFGLCHRHELSGVLHGLFRVRAFTQDDAHIFCTPEQLDQELNSFIKLAQDTYHTFGFDKVSMVLATRPEKSMGSDEIWQIATDALRKALTANNVPYTVAEGDGAFYGPKVDMYIEDAMGRKWQCATVQVDINLPERFNLTYVAPDGSRQVPIMVHRAIYGSLERFMGVLIEHYKGNLPFWISPVQVKVLTITDEQKPAARDLLKLIADNNFRAELDESSDPISGQIKVAQQEKVPVMLVLGKKEVEQGTVTLRHRDGKQEVGIPMANIIARLQELNRH